MFSLGAPHKLPLLSPGLLNLSSGFRRAYKINGGAYYIRGGL